MMSKKLFHNNGFTIIELMVAMVLTTVVGVAVVTSTISQKKNFTMNRQVGNMQQNLGGSIYVMEQDIRMAGYDPKETGLFGITSIQPWVVTSDTADPVPSVGFLPFTTGPSLMLSGDDNRDSVADPTDDNGVLDPLENIAYRLYDNDGDGLWDLARDVGTPGVAGFTRQLVAEGVEHVGLAYAIDNDNDGSLDTTPNGNIIWAADSNWDGVLDTNLDTNDDGRITVDDDSNSDQRITLTDGAAGNLATVAPGSFPVKLDKIRAVRIWLLARTPVKGDDYLNSKRYYVVGDQIWPQRTAQTPFPLGYQDGIRRHVLVRTIDCRNL
jgi:type IV pilus assembly protein PilW